MKPTVKHVEFCSLMKSLAVIGVLMAGPAGCATIMEGGTGL